MTEVLERIQQTLEDALNSDMAMRETDEGGESETINELAQAHKDLTTYINKLKGEQPVKEVVNFDPSNLDYGIYKIFWKSGGCSLASVGGTYNGTRWLAPTNWTCGEGKPFEATTDWGGVAGVEVVIANGGFDRDEDFESVIKTIRGIQ